MRDQDAGSTTKAGHTVTEVANYGGRSWPVFAVLAGSLLTVALARHRGRRRIS